MEKYITKSEYRDAKGINLDIELHDLDDGSNKSDRFIKQITDWCVAHLKERYRAFDLDYWPDEGDPTDAILTEKRQRLFREGVMEQIEYLLSNGNLIQHAGLNLQTGLIANISAIDLSRSAKAKFRLAGFCNI